MRIKKMRKSFSYCLTTDSLQGELFFIIDQKKKDEKNRSSIRIILRGEKKEVSKR